MCWSTCATTQPNSPCLRNYSTQIMALSACWFLRGRRSLRQLTAIRPLPPIHQTRPPETARGSGVSNHAASLLQLRRLLRLVAELPVPGAAHISASRRATVRSDDFSVDASTGNASLSAADRSKLDGSRQSSMARLRQACVTPPPVGCQLAVVVPSVRRTRSCLPVFILAWNRRTVGLLVFLCVLWLHQQRMQV
jgi:hypothetical protein